jgi:hypothetical protein
VWFGAVMCSDVLFIIVLCFAECRRQADDETRLLYATFDAAFAYFRSSEKKRKTRRKLRVGVGEGSSGDDSGEEAEEALIGSEEFYLGFALVSTN